MRVITTIFCLFLTSNAMAIEYKTKNYFNAGINIFYRDYSEDLVLPRKSDESGLLYGILIGYEHKFPESIFFTIDYSLSRGKTHYDGSTIYFDNGEIRPRESSTINSFFNLDSELGYTFLTRNEKFLITPFIGLGISNWFRSLDDIYGSDELYVWSYASSGLQFDYNADKQSQYGIRFKIMQMIHGIIKSSDMVEDHLTLGNKTLYEISAPILYRQNPDCKSYWRFTPYYQYLRFGESNMGTLDSFYYDVLLYEPASRTHILGAKLEYAFGF